jgi:hypothetical protein
MYWKTLPREEREQWEAKAVIAQAEHRKRYPDWRFRPGANAMAKLKVKDGPGTNKRRHHHPRKAKEEGEDHDKSKDKRCAKIADLLVEGKKGLDLEVAVKEWEGDRMNTKERGAKVCPDVSRQGDPEDQPAGTRSSGDTQRPHPGTIHDEGVTTIEGPGDAVGQNHLVENGKDTAYAAENTTKNRSRTPDAVSDARFKVPLTSMFRRSLSAPACHTRSPCPDAASPSSVIPIHGRRDTVSLPMTDSSTCSPPLFANLKQHEAAARRNDNNDALDCLPSSRLSFIDSVSTRCNDVSPKSLCDTPNPRC